jgi:hypothetical protein
MRIAPGQTTAAEWITPDSGRGLNTVDIKILKDGMASTPGVTATKAMAWVGEGKLNYMQDPAMRGKDPGEFHMFAVPLPKE